jgi:hypothetical protein
VTTLPPRGPEGDALQLRERDLRSDFPQVRERDLRSDFPQVRERDLRNAATPAAVERVWNRLEESTLQRRQISSRGPWVWSVAGSALTFVVGIWVGSAQRPEGASNGVPSAEPPRPAAAGRLAAEVVSETPAVSPEASAAAEAKPASPRRRSVVPVLAPPLEGVVLEPPAPLDVPLVAVTPPTSEVNVPPAWQRLANGGEYEAALYELGERGGFEQAIGHASPEQLMLLFDVARATAQHQRALAALRRIVSEYSTDPVAPLAAWSLANLLEKLGDADGARQAFATYRALSPAGEFAEDALVRQLKNAIAAKDPTSAARLAAQYLADFPEGRRLREVASWQAHLESSGATADGGLTETVDLGEPAESAE